MLELICQQRYRVGGSPVDLSPYRNHGVAIDAFGVAGPGHDAIGFPNADSRIEVGLGSAGAWSPLQALKIEVTAKLDTQAGRTLTLAAGDGAFELFIIEGALAARVGGDTVRSADADSPDGQPHNVPSNRWTTLGLHHDGAAKLTLFIDGALVAGKLVSGSVPSVQAGGVTIGNRPGGGQPLLGDIDEISVWRQDPKAMRREFLSRPLTADQVRCWEANARAVAVWMAGHPDQAKALGSLASGQIHTLVRGLYLLSPAEQARMRRHLVDQVKPWIAGKITSRAMDRAWRGWLADLRRLGLESPNSRSEVLALISDFDLKSLSLDCDPAVTKFLHLIARAAKAADKKAK